MAPEFERVGVSEVRRDLFLGRGIRDAVALREVLRPLRLTEGPVLIKPNWFSSYAGQFTSARALALFCDAIAGLKVVVEGHAALRNDGARELTPVNARSNWSWIKEQEKTYFERLGLDAVLERDDVVYVNVTDEVWGGDVVPEAEVRSALRGKNLVFDELYGVVPAKLMAWRGRPLISLARAKLPEPGRTGDAFSLSLKNMFGLIPDPDRGAYHPRLPEAVTDVNLLYGGFFDVYGCVEALENAVRVSEQGLHDTAWGDRYNLFDAGATVVVGRNAAAVDAFGGALFGVDLSDRALLTAATERMGPWDKMLILEAQRYGVII